MIERRQFPGEIERPGWKYIYIEAADVKTFLRLFEQIGDYIEAREEIFPEGGFGTANARLDLPDGSSFFGISVKGDIDTYLTHIRSFAWSNGLKTIVFEDSKAVVHGIDGSELLDLRSCKKSFFDF